jgi:hypothetical protein
MNQAIAHIIKSEIEGLDFVDKIAGLVAPLTFDIAIGDGKSVEKTFPIACCVSPEDCKEGAYNDLMPNSQYKTVIYFEDKGVTFVKSESHWKYYTSNLRLVCWINIEKLTNSGYCKSEVPCTYAAHIITEIIRSMPEFPLNITPFHQFYSEIVSQDVRNPSIFSAYTYDEKHSQYLMAPYDYFALDITTNFAICLNSDVVPSPCDNVIDQMIPTALDAELIGCDSFMALWEEETEATGYYLDVATDSLFTSFVSGYQNLDVGNITQYKITGLLSTIYYYYRIRAYDDTDVSDYSNTIIVDFPWSCLWDRIYSAMSIKPIDPILTAQKNLIEELHAIGSLQKAKVIDVFATQTGGSAINWISPGIFDPIIVNIPVFVAYEGYKAVSGTTSYINLNFNPLIDGGNIGKDNIFFLVGFGDDAINNGQYGALSTIGGDDVLLGGRIKSDAIGTGYYGCNGDDTTNNLYRNFIWTSKKHIAISRGKNNEMDTYINYSRNNDNLCNSNHCINISPFLGCINNHGSPTDYDNDRTIRYAFISEYLTETEALATIKAFETYLTAIGKGLITETLFNLALEGHSFLDGQRNISWLSQRIMENLPCVKTINKAVSGSSLDMMTARASSLDIEINNSYTNKLIIYNGVNDVTDIIGSGIVAYNKLKLYVQNRIIAGWDEIYVYTMTPATSGRGTQFEFERTQFNDLLRTDLEPIGGIYILDTDFIYQLNDSTDVDYYSGGLHFNSLLGGGAELASVLAILTLNNHLPETINDGNTWNYSNCDDVSKFTVNGSNQIALWTKYKGSGLNLSQSNNTLKPLLTVDGVLTDGGDDSLYTGPATLNQPLTYYEMFRMKTFINDGMIHDGAGWSSLCLYETPTTGKLKIYAGTDLASGGFPKDHTTNKWGIMRCIYDGVNSKIVANCGSIVAAYNGISGDVSKGDAGTTNAGGLTIGSRGGGTDQASNTEYKEILVRTLSEIPAIENRFFLHILFKWLTIIDPDYPN